MIVGIDLGTTNSLIAVWRDGRAELIPNALGEVLTPSCVSLDEQGRVLVGRPARDRLLTAPHASAAHFKRYMGSERLLHLGGRAFRPEELSALVLKALKADAEAWLGQPVTEAVITVPAYFNDLQRKATRIAGELAGLKVERLLNEPTAAALAYGLAQAAPEAQFLVFDLGGGTFDVSLLEVFEGVMEVRATAGDNFLGGEDFTEALVAAFLQQMRPAGLEAARLTAPEQAQLRIEAERVKRSLSDAQSALFCFRHGERSYEWPLTQGAFEALCAPLLERLHAPLERALRDARLQLGQLDQLLLVGGATRMGVVYRLLTRLLGRFPSRAIDPDQAVALGAAVQAGLKARDAALQEVVLTDVAPYTMGIAVTSARDGLQRDGVFLPLIERNTTVPASFVKTVYPHQPGQAAAEVRIYQGESRDVADNILLGTLQLSLAGVPRAAQAIDVRFSYDINGLLEVEATIAATGHSCRTVIERSPGSMSEEQIARSLERLRQLKLLPRAESVPHALLQRMKRLYEQSLGERRAWIGERISQFESLLLRESPRELARSIEVLTHMLDRFEGAPVS